MIFHTKSYNLSVIKKKKKNEVKRLRMVPELGVQFWGKDEGKLLQGRNAMFWNACDSL